MSNCPPNLTFLIDESLSPGLTDVVSARGFRAHAVGRDKKLRGRPDSAIAKYAIDNDMILVTNNVVDFERIYERREYHPGLVFISTETPELRKKKIQIMMMNMALDDIERDCLLQEALDLFAHVEDGEVVVDIGRYYLPALASAEAAA